MCARSPTFTLTLALTLTLELPLLLFPNRSLLLRIFMALKEWGSRESTKA